MVKFHSHRGTVMQAVVEADRNLGDMVSIRIGQDPFPTFVDHRQLVLVRMGNTQQEEPSVPTKTSGSNTQTKELRRKAQQLDIEGWEEMTRAELARAVKQAEADNSDDDETEEDVEDAAAEEEQETTSEDTEDEDTESEDDESEDDEEEEEVPTKRTSKRAGATKTAAKRTTSRSAAPAKKAPAKKAAPAKRATKQREAPRPPVNPDTPNPFRPGTNLYHFTEALMKGGKRSALVKKLLPKLEYNPRVQKASDFDAEAETDYRLKVVGGILKNQHGWEYTVERGADGFIQATPPS